MQTGWIKIHRKMLDWGWYGDIPTKILFLHLLLTVNYEEKIWRGQTIRPGEIITSVAHLAKATQLSVKQIRGAMQKLENTGEVARKTTNRFTHLTLIKWEEYQTRDDAGANKTTNKGQTKGKRRATTKEGKKVRKQEEHIAPATPDAGPINQVLEKFQMTVNPGINYGNKTSRKAAQWLIDKMGIEKTIRTIEYLETIRSEPYAPIITTPYQLKEKFGQLIAYAEKKNVTANKNQIAIIE